MGGLSWFSIWQTNPQVKECFPRKTYLSHVKEYEVDGAVKFGYGVSSHTRAHIVSFMGAFLEGVLHPHLQCNIFPSPLLQLIYYGCNIECYMQWKVRSTLIPLGAKNTLSVMCKESKRHCKCIPSTSRTFISYVFYFIGL